MNERKPLRSKLVKCERKSFSELVFLFCVTFPHHFYDAVLNRRRVFLFHRSLSHFQSLFTSFLFAIHEIFLSPFVDGRNCGYLYLFYLNCLCLRRARERAEEKRGELRRKANDLSRNNKQEKRFFRIMGNCGRSSLGNCTSVCCRGCHRRCPTGQKISMNEWTSLKIGKHLHPRQQSLAVMASRPRANLLQSWLDSTMVNIGFVFSTSNKKFFISLRKFGSRLDVRCLGWEREGKATWWAGDWWCYSCYVCTHITFNMHVLDADALPAKLKLKIIQILPLTMRRIREKSFLPRSILKGSDGR